jgi:hypothetical protein
VRRRDKADGRAYDQLDLPPRILCATASNPGGHMGAGRSYAASVAALLLCSTSSLTWAEGLQWRADQEPWPKLQARVSLALGNPAFASLSLPSGNAGLQGGRILGDYYFGDIKDVGGRGFSGGFRATSGLWLSTRGISLSQPSVPRAGLPLSVTQLSLSPNAGDPTADVSHGAAYLGVGYTGLSPKGGWGFTADLGVLAGGGGLRVARSVLPDESTRDFRLTPVLQLGVSYSF